MLNSIEQNKMKNYKSLQHKLAKSNVIKTVASDFYFSCAPHSVVFRCCLLLCLPSSHVDISTDVA